MFLGVVYAISVAFYAQQRGQSEATKGEFEFATLVFSLGLINSLISYLFVLTATAT